MVIRRRYVGLEDPMVIPCDIACYPHSAGVIGHKAGKPLATRWPRGHGRVGKRDRRERFRDRPAACGKARIPVRDAVTLSPTGSDRGKLRWHGAQIGCAPHRRPWRARRFRDHFRA